MPQTRRLTPFRSFAAIKKRALIFCLFLAALFAACPAFSSQTVIATVNVNSVARGEYFVILEDSGNVLVMTKDLRDMDFRDPKGRTLVIDGEEYISLSSMKGVAFSFDERKITLVIDAAPELLLKRTIDFMPVHGARVYYPRDTSAFLNYRLNYAGGGGLSYQSFGLTNQLGARWRDILFLGDTSYLQTPEERRFTRLMTALTYDDRTRLRRGVAGDFFASSGELGSNLNMGGVSFSKSYKLDPYLIRYPTLNLGGLTSMPSDVEIYIDGIRIVSDKLAPGEFEIRNITHSGGAHNVEVVIRDPFGNVQRISHPFYQTETLLGRGLSEYSYNAGYLRQAFGVKSWRYADAAFSFFHRHGYSDRLTLALRGEAGNGVYALGPEASALLGSAGVVTISALADRERSGTTGAAASLNHYYQTRGLSTRLLLRGYSRAFTTVASSGAQLRTKTETAAGVGFGLGKYGNLSLDYTLVKRYNAIDTSAVTASFSRSLWQTATVITTLKRKVEAEPFYEAFLGLVYYFGEDSSFSTHYNKTRHTNAETLQLVSPAPSVGEGVGLRASLDRLSTDGNGSAAYIMNPTLDYNARRAVLRADYRARRNQQGTDELYDLSVAGAIAYVGSTVALTRPIYDSFGMVKAGDIKDVRAYVNNQEVGRTDKNGVVFIPSLGSFYDNRISIEQKDVPMDYLLPEVLRTVSPPLRSGSCIVFDARRIRAFMGKLRDADSGADKPIEFYEVKVAAGGRTFSFPTGKDGEFYFENTDVEKKTKADDKKTGCESIGSEELLAELKPGIYRATVIYNARPCAFDINIPANDETFVDLGNMTCTPVPEPVSLPAQTAIPEPAPVPPLTPALSSGLVVVEPAVPFKEPASSALPMELVKESASSALPVELVKEPTSSALPVELVEKPASSVLPVELVEEPAPSALPVELVEEPASSALPVESEASAPLADPQAAPAKTAALSSRVTVNVIPGAPAAVPLPLPASFSVRQTFDGDIPSTIEDILILYDTANAIMNTPDAVVHIEGHCDQLGTDAYNMRLGLKRAETVKMALAGVGVPMERIVSVRSFGKRRPVCRKDLGTECRAKNRRVEIRLGKALDGAKKQR